MASFMSDIALKFLKHEDKENTKAEDIQDTKQAIKLCKSYLESKKKSSASKLVTVSV